MLLSSEKLLIVGASGTLGSPKKCRGPTSRCSSRCVSDRRSLALITYALMAHPSRLVRSVAKSRLSLPRPRVLRESSSVSCIRFRVAGGRGSERGLSDIEALSDIAPTPQSIGLQ